MITIPTMAMTTIRAIEFVFEASVIEKDLFIGYNISNDVIYIK
jgi:hypothetical protein